MTKENKKIQRTVYMDSYIYKFLEKETKKRHLDKVNTLISVLLREYYELQNLREREKEAGT